MEDRKIILASASPRRRELLQSVGLEFEVMTSDVDESGIDKSLPPDLYVRELAVLKAAVAVKAVRAEKRAAVIIAADTIVSLNGEIMGKPADSEDAYRMLKTLSGNTHEVYTGVCVINSDTGDASGKSVKTCVRFKKLTDEKIRAYIATGEPFDKAGAYGIQGMGKLLIDSISGDYFNVVGLPVAALADILERDFGIGIM